MNALEALKELLEESGRDSIPSPEIAARCLRPGCEVRFELRSFAAAGLVRQTELGWTTTELAAADEALAEEATAVEAFAMQQQATAAVAETPKKTLAELALERDGGDANNASGTQVRESLVMATSQGFSAVSEIWLAKTQPFGAVVADLMAEAEDKWDAEVSPAEFRFSSDGRLHITVGEAETALRIAETAEDGLYSRTGVPRTMTGQLRTAAEVGDKKAARLLGELLNWGFERTQGDRPRGDAPLFVRAHGENMRAVFSDRYGVIDNSWLLETLGKLVPGGRVSHYRNDGDTVSGIVLIPDTIRKETDSEYGGGIGFANSEVGRLRLSVQPAVFRAICANGCIWNRLNAESSLRKLHLGKIDLEGLARIISALVNEAIPLATASIDELLAAKEIRLTSPVEVLKVMVRNSQTAERARAWAAGWVEEGKDLTAFHVLNGLTRAARSCEIGALGRSLEEFAASMTSADWWERELRVAAAGAVSDEKLAKVFGEGFPALLG